MRLLAALLLLVPSLALAGTITDPIPVTTSACTMSYLPVACGSMTNPTTQGTERLDIGNAISILGLNTAAGLDIEAWDFAEGGTVGSPDDGADSSAFIRTTLDFLGTTGGPPRQGFATFLILTDHEWGWPGGGMAFGSISGLGNCEGACSMYRTMVPFELGVPFEVSLNLYAFSGDGEHAFSGGSAYALIQLQLFDASGDAVVIFDPPDTASAVPEPSGFMLAALGITLLISRARAIPAARRHS